MRILCREKRGQSKYIDRLSARDRFDSETIDIAHLLIILRRSMSPFAECRQERPSLAFLDRFDGHANSQAERNPVVASDSLMKFKQDPAERYRLRFHPRRFGVSLSLSLSKKRKKKRVGALLLSHASMRILQRAARKPLRVHENMEARCDAGDVTAGMKTSHRFGILAFDVPPESASRILPWDELYR